MEYFFGEVSHAKFLLKLVCGHSRETRFRYELAEPKWDQAFCDECHAVKAVEQMAPAYNSKEVEL